MPDDCSASIYDDVSGSFVSARAGLPSGAGGCHSGSACGNSGTAGVHYEDLVAKGDAEFFGLSAVEYCSACDRRCLQEGSLCTGYECSPGCSGADERSSTAQDLSYEGTGGLCRANSGKAHCRLWRARIARQDAVTDDPDLPCKSVVLELGLMVPVPRWDLRCFARITNPASERCKARQARFAERESSLARRASLLRDSGRLRATGVLASALRVVGAGICRVLVRGRSVMRRMASVTATCPSDATPANRIVVAAPICAAARMR